MKKKRKKHHPPVNEKASRAHHRNEFLRNINHICLELTGRQVFDLIENRGLDLLYISRSLFRIVPAKDNRIRNRTIRYFRLIMSSFLKAKVPLIENRAEISRKDYFEYWLTLIDAVNRMPTEALRVKEFNKLFEPHMKIVDLYEGVINYLNQIMDYITNTFSDYEEGIIWHKHKLRIDLNGKVGMFECMDIYSHIPEKIHVDVDGLSRPAIRLCWGFANNESKVYNADIDSQLLCGSTGTASRLLPVYIQLHAINRLYERIDIPPTGWLQFGLFEACSTPVICTNSKGALLIEYRLFGVKAGYLRAELHKDILLIHTFLFLTNNGTPEGEKLHENTGLKKEDKMYLAIDKLSSFILSDIPKNEIVKDIFIQAGCGCLFEMDSKKLYGPSEIDGIKEKSMAVRIAHYLGLETDAEFMEELENIEENEE